MVTIIFKRFDFNNSKWGARLGFSALELEMHMKQAAAFKLNQLASNARNLHYSMTPSSVFKTYFSHALSAYALHGTEYIQAGGLFWSWRKIRDGTIFNEEGLWYSARLVAVNMSQFFSPILLLLIGVSMM